VNGTASSHSNGISNGFQNGHKDIPEEDPARLFVLSSFDEVSSKHQVENLQRYLEERLDTSNPKLLNDLAYTLNERRTHHVWRAAIVARSAKELVQSMNNGVPFSSSVVTKRRLGFVFTGQGAQWCGMGKELISKYPVFRASLEKSSMFLIDTGALFDVIGRHISYSKIALLC
jgi:acyl transferase domain-containing protein